MNHPLNIKLEYWDHELQKMANKLMEDRNVSEEMKPTPGRWIDTLSEEYKKGLNIPAAVNQSDHVKILIKALEYCSVEPELLRPENNRQCAAASNALNAYRRATEGES